MMRSLKIICGQGEKVPSALGHLRDDDTQMGAVEVRL